MNRGSLLIGGLRAAGAGASAASLRPFAFAAQPRLHPSIQANIDYWMKASPEWLAECPPFHTSYYAVKEDGRLRVYAVKWNGANLYDHHLSVPENESGLIAQCQAAIREASHPNQNMDIGAEIEMSSGTVRICSYVFDSPLRRVKRWGSSLSTSLLARNTFYKLRSKDVI